MKLEESERLAALLTAAKALADKLDEIVAHPAYHGESIGGAPDALLPSQYNRNPDYSGEVRLIFAVLEDAIRVFVKYDQVGRKPLAYYDVLDWFYSDGVWPFSFVSVCGNLGLDVGAFRKRLKDRKIVNPIRRQAIKAA